MYIGIAQIKLSDQLKLKEVNLFSRSVNEVYENIVIIHWSIFKNHITNNITSILVIVSL